MSDDGSVIVCPFGDADALEQALAEPVAAVLMEPVPCNFGTFEPPPGYLARVRELCDAAGALLIFDEVITGFRLALGGAQERYGVTPDLTVLSKGIGSGLPVAALAGREAVMRTAADGMKMVGTYNGTPVPVAAACATLAELSARAGELYPGIEALSGELAGGLRSLGARHGAPLVVQQVGPVLQLLWGTPDPVQLVRRRERDRPRRGRAAVGAARRAGRQLARARAVVRVRRAPARGRRAHAGGGRPGAGADAGRGARMRPDQIGIVVTDIEQAMRRWGRCSTAARGASTPTAPRSSATRRSAGRRGRSRCGWRSPAPGRRSS